MNIKDMKPRQVDSLCIEHIMRYGLFESSDAHTVAFWNDSAQCFYAFMQPNAAAVPFRPSTSLDDAWLIVERFEDANVSIHYVPGAGVRCSIYFFNEVFGDKEFHAVGDTPQEAICRAALFAKGAIDVAGDLIEPEPKVRLPPEEMDNVWKNMERFLKSVASE